MFSSMTGYIRGDFRRRRGRADPDRAGVHRGGRDARLPPAEPARHRPGRQGPAGAARKPRCPARCGSPPHAPWRNSAQLAERAKVTFCLENLNTAVDHPGVPFARAADTIALVEAVGHPHVRLMLDLYHAQIGEGNLIELVRRAGPLIGEIQVADVPGRCEPGTGEISYPAVAAALDRAGLPGHGGPGGLGRRRRHRPRAGPLPVRLHPGPFIPNEHGSRPPATGSRSFRNHQAPGFRVLLIRQRLHGGTMTRATQDQPGCPAHCGTGHRRITTGPVFASTVFASTVFAGPVFASTAIARPPATRSTCTT